MSILWDTLVTPRFIAQGKGKMKTIGFWINTKKKGVELKVSLIEWGNPEILIHTAHNGSSWFCTNPQLITKAQMRKSQNFNS
jgi:hypothetical protein